ncbi:hypothetical protein [Paenibacillus alba]|uniref:Flagellar protein FliT n=1 Tax=Paenibacillus alba TaxID=1197127 RepID=A0ABU6G153_9BACL|nr:hypothetical protein [Paenibacillus alba]MEC0227897.1 hypothetical protein [Paenibacillus alba]
MIIEVLLELKRIMHLLMEHDIEDESQVLILSRLQIEQLELCEKLDSYGDIPRNKEIQLLANECKELEQLFNNKLNNFQQEIKNQIEKFNQVDQLRNAYHNSFSQAEGYFVDSKK